MSYQVLYRTYRPQRFEEVVGQDYIIKTLKNAIKLNKVAHAYLFAGPRGTGKTTVAKLFAKAINCPIFDNESCDKCDSCQSYNKGNHPDIIEMDAASNNGVDDVRKIVEEIPYSPILGRYKVYIIDEAHMLTANAFNALLKTLEEPPEHVVFILATTDPQKVIPTVLSRCQRYNFSKISVVDMKKKMMEILKKEDIEFEEKAIEEIALLAEGGMRDALSTLEQILSYNANGIYLEDVEKIFGLSSTEEKVKLLVNTHTQNINEVISNLRQMYNQGIDIKRLAIDLLEIIKDVLLYSENGSNKLLEKTNSIQAQEILNNTGVKTLLQDIKYLEECITKTNANQNFLSYLELCLIQMSGNTSTHYQEPIKELPKEEIKPQIIKEEIVIQEKEEEKVNEENNLDFIARLLVYATRESKINDAVIYNRLELYKYEADKRKFYELLNGTELFASTSEAIIVSAPKLKADTINSRETNEEIFDFINKEIGINKMVYAFNEEEKNELIKKYKELTPEQKKEKPEVIKYETKKPKSTEDKLKEWFDKVSVE